MLRILLIGSWNAEILARQLRHYGADAKASTYPLTDFPNLASFKDYKIVYGVYLMSIRTIFRVKIHRRKCVTHVVGSDAYRYASLKGLKKNLWNAALSFCDEILYVTEDLKRLMGLKRGKVIPIPIDTKVFKKINYEGQKRDILYYCPNPQTYRLDWILQYAKNHREETITILGYTNSLELPNVKVISHMNYEQMPKLYAMHRRLIRMTTHDGYPKMPYEAFLCGLEVIWNERKITEVPAEMLMENTIPKLISFLEEL